jgi:hypothetical protein
LIIDDGCRERADLIVRTDGRSVRS